MSSTYLGITEHVSSWVDLQEIIKDVSSCTNRRPSMRESLIAFGFEGDNQAILPNRMAHSAGTDALRIIALLVNLLALSPNATLEVDRRPVRKWMADSFSKYGPPAIGIHGGKKEGYICLPSLDELDQFIEHTNGSSAGNGQFWDAISEFDPQFTASRTASELLESLEAASAAAIEQKKVLRKQKKEKEKIDSEQTCLDFVKSVDDLGLGELWG
ncbi:hypothetical protein diail_271 [Diaporthe ilicicola]|nr:hypothetical protein diail_271 [Diaporthe ilicicola]